MFRWFSLVLLAGCLAMAAQAANMTIVINGKTISVPTIVQNGKTYLDFGALLKALGSSASFDAKASKLVINVAPGAGAAGTAQLAGDNGEFGKVYTLRKHEPLYFSLVRARYTVEQVLVGDRLIAPKADEKLLVLHFSVQNPGKTDLLVRSDSLRIMAIDQMNVNHPCESVWGDAETQQQVGLLLKPAQKLLIYAVIRVPAKGVVPKLMIQSNHDNDGPVLRYDLRGKVEALPAPYADPADATGATALMEVPAELGGMYPCNDYTVAIEKIEYTTGALEGRVPGPNERYLVATMRVKYVNTFGSALRTDTFRASCLTTDGEELGFKSVLMASDDRRVGASVRQGSPEIRMRMYFVVPKGVTLQTMSIFEDQSRRFVYQIPAE
jgi:hypothetical protein